MASTEKIRIYTPRGLGSQIYTDERNLVLIRNSSGVITSAGSFLIPRDAYESHKESIDDMY